MRALIILCESVLHYLRYVAGSALALLRTGWIANAYQCCH
jgi:hypothetical protein